MAIYVADWHFCNLIEHFGTISPLGAPSAKMSLPLDYRVNAELESMNCLRLDFVRRCSLFTIALLAGIVTPGFALAERPQQQRATQESPEVTRQIQAADFRSLRQAIEDLAQTHGDAYPRATEFLSRLSRLEARFQQAETAAAQNPERSANLRKKLDALKREALLENPDLRGLQILCVKRKWMNRVWPGNLSKLGIPSNHECHSSLNPTGYDNEIALFAADRPGQTWRSIHRPADKGWVGDLDLHWDAQRLLFAEADATQWSLWEMALDGSGLRQITRTPADVDCFDGCYLPSGKILFASNATGQCVPCWHGVSRKYVANLFTINADGSEMRRITFDQDHNVDPAVLEDGRVVYNRWDYTGLNRVFARPLMAMNPDGTAQRAFYGSNSWFPNGLYSPQPIPGRLGQLLCIISGYHGPGRTGHLVVLDTDRGRQEATGIVQRISGRNLPLEVKYMDRLTEEEWPKFRTCCPITEKQFLVTGWMSPESHSMGVYLADVFDNLLLLHEDENYALLEPVPVIPRKTPPVIPPHTNYQRKDATVYLQDVYFGPGLAGVPRGTVKQLRVIAYHFGYIGLAGNDKIGLSGPWEAMRILGTTPVQEDGSAMFRIPADTPVAFQAVDAEGKAVQLMRSWLSARPGEIVSCVGCHEHPTSIPPVKESLALSTPPAELKSWYGPARGFDFAREVQPVLNKHCIGCHDGTQANMDLRPEEMVPEYEGRIPGRLDFTRMHPTHRALHDGRVKYTPAYEALLPYIRRVGVGDDVGILTPGYYHADTSELIQLLQKGHHGVGLDTEAWDRLVTWIDLNGPCHGTWGDVFEMPVPEAADQRRMELFDLYGGPLVNPELIPQARSYDSTPVAASEPPKPATLALAGWPFDGVKKRESAGETGVKHLSLGHGVELAIVKIPAGRFVIGDANGLADESPLSVVEIDRPFWMGVGEISNEQFLQFQASHHSGHFAKRYLDAEGVQGMELNAPDQPALKVSWDEAMEFCAWLSRRTGLTVSLPTEAQWEYACRAGADSAYSFGDADADYSPFANCADKTFATVGYRGKSLTGHFEVASGIDYLIPEGVPQADRRFNDHFCVTAPIQSGRQPNAFGLVDMHGNAAEWTRSVYRPYPYDVTDGRDATDAVGEKVVRGGSFLDRPQRCRSAVRYSYPAWQKVHNVGFRVVVNGPLTKAER